MNVKLSIFVLMFLLVAGFGVAAPLVFRDYQPASAGELPVLGNVPAFSFIDSTGESFTSENLRGKIWVLNFFFTRCNGPCPVMNAQVARLARRFQAAPDVQFLSVTVDPEHDNPEVLSAYQKKFASDPQKWHFLTGDKKAIAAFGREGVKLLVDEATLHSTKLVLIDRRGQVRGYYDTELQASEVDTLGRDIAKLADGRA